jgi:RimJ/RimL family protein N-acetyltransferase
MEMAYPDPPLRGERVALRPWTDADLAAMLVAFGDPVVQRFSWTRSEPYTEADARAFLVEIEARRLRGEGVEFAFVEPDDDGAILGGGGIYDRDADERRAAIGYWLAAHARGRGVATEAVRLLARWSFDRLQLERLQITCGPDNIASQRVAERCGFTREGVLRSHMAFKGGRRDTVVFSLLPGELSDPGTPPPPAT